MALRQISSRTSVSSIRTCFYSSHAAAVSSKFYDVPEGHINSDLSQVVCNIGLNRRRELTLGAAGDIKLTVDGQPHRLADLFKVIYYLLPSCFIPIPSPHPNFPFSHHAYISPLPYPTQHPFFFLQNKKTIIFGVPDMGKVCSEQHVPGYVKQWEELRKHGIDQIFCIVVANPAEAMAWGKTVGADGSKGVTIAADPIQAATRIMGMELGDPTAPGPRSLRYAAILDNGVILKVVRVVYRYFFMNSTHSISHVPTRILLQKVDKSPAEVKESGAASILQAVKAIQQ